MKTLHFHDKHQAMVDDCLNRKPGNIAGETGAQCQRQLGQPKMMRWLVVIWMFLQVQRRNQFRPVVQLHPKQTQLFSN